MDPKSAQALLDKYPTRSPVIVKSNDHGLSMIRSKYLVPNDLKLGEFMAVIRRYISSLTPQEALYAFFNNRIYPQNTEIGNIFNIEQRDFYLSMVIRKETTFG